MRTDALLLPSSKLNFPCTVRIPAELFLEPESRSSSAMANLSFPASGSSPMKGSSGGGGSSAVTVKADNEGLITFHGLLLEVRLLHSLEGPTERLFGFVRWQNADHRQSGWYPLSHIALKHPTAVLEQIQLHLARQAPHTSSWTNDSFREEKRQEEEEKDAELVEIEGQTTVLGKGGKLDRSNKTDGSHNHTNDINSGKGTGKGHHETAGKKKTEPEVVVVIDEEEEEEPLLSSSPAVAQRADQVITQPLLSTIYREITAGMARTVRSTKTLEYLEERLLRDGSSPTCIRYYSYLNTYLFSPWYFAPYGALNFEYDPLLTQCPAPETFRTGSSPTAHALDSSPNVSSHTSGAAAAVSRPVMNPYIRDAYLCPFSLRVYSSKQQMVHETRHCRVGRLRPPGTEIYRDERRGLSVFEVNGSKHKTYSRYLFLLGKSFLENKLAGHDVHNYYFYVVCFHHKHFPNYIDDPEAMYFAGYFSWEKGVREYNLACIVTLPCFAGTSGNSGSPNLPRQLGQFMIALSYELSYRRELVGTPERPLSDLGELAYRRYWQRVLLPWLQLKSLEVGSNRVLRTGKRPREELLVDTPSTSFDSTEPSPSQSVSVPTTVREMAQFSRLEEADVLKCVVEMGLLHRSGEDRSICLVIPVESVCRQMEEQEQRAASLKYAVLDPALLHSVENKKTPQKGP